MWPPRVRTPPAVYRSGKMCPGRTSSVGCVSGFASARMVVARSHADTPVVTPAQNNPQPRVQTFAQNQEQQKKVRANRRIQIHGARRRRITSTLSKLQFDPCSP